MDKMFLSSGILEYGENFRLVLNIDKEISYYYKSLIPKYKSIISPGYTPHITIVRIHKEIPNNLEAWGKYQGKEIEFCYSPIIHYEDYFYWLDAWSVELENIREELGLPVTYRTLIPPKGFRKNFHFTIALDELALKRNQKGNECA